MKKNKSVSERVIRATRYKIIVILGTTSSGKTKLAVRLAKKFNGEIISADSRQVYRGMDVGSGKDLAEYGKIKYHLIDIVSPKKDFSVAAWQKLAYQKIEDIVKQGKLPIVCGGTGLYISALVEGYLMPEEIVDKAVRNKLNKKSLKQLLDQLKRIDLDTYNIIDRNNRRRVQRALEIYYQSGRPKSKMVGKIKPDLDFLKIGLTFPRNVLNRRIAKRLKIRLTKEGMVKEVEMLRQSGVSWKKLEAFGLEYRFVARYLQGKLTYQEMEDDLAKAIKDFAKRQMTWFKRDKEINWIKNYSQAVVLVKKFIK